MSAPASIPHVGAILACLVVISKSYCKFIIVSDFCLIVDSHFHPSRALTNSLEAFTPSTWTYFCYIASTTPEEIVNILQDKYKITIYLESKYPHDPGGTMICQLMKYLGKLYVNLNILFKDLLLTDLQISFEIIKLLITEGNLNLIHESTYEHLHHLSRKRKLNKLYNEV